MDNFSKDFNKILAETYHSLLLMEETKRKYSKAKFSFRDRNTISFLKRSEGGRMISEIADYLKISRPSATLLVKKLEKSGLVEKRTDPENERNTIVTLTRKGRLFSTYQKRYRDRLARRVSEDLTEDEKKALYKGFTKLNEFFLSSIEESESIHRE